MMEEHRSHIVQVAIECKQTPPRLIRPHLDLVVIATRHKQRLRLVEVNSSDWPIMLFEAVYKRSHAVVP